MLICKFLKLPLIYTILRKMQGKTVKLSDDDYNKLVEQIKTDLKL